MKVDVNGIATEYKISGPADAEETVVLLQGWGTTLDLYDYVDECINGKVRFVRLDLPGFGKTPEASEPWDVDGFCDFFEAFLQQLNIRKCTLMGHSYGGRMIIKLANRETLPFEIERIILMDAAGIKRQLSAKQQAKVRRYKALKKVVESPFIGFFCPGMAEQWKSTQGSEDYRNASPLMRVCMVKALNEDLTPYLSGIRQETLLIWGSEDTATPLSDGELMKQMIPNSGLCVLPGAGHFSFLDAPVQFKGIMHSYFEIG